MELVLSECMSFNTRILLEKYMERETVDKSIMKLIRFRFGRLWSSGEHRSLHTFGSAPVYWALLEDGAE